MLTEKYLVRHFLGIQQSLGEGELENVYWIPGTENPADGFTKLRSEMGPDFGLVGDGQFSARCVATASGVGLSGMKSQSPSPSLVRFAIPKFRVGGLF